MPHQKTKKIPEVSDELLKQYYLQHLASQERYKAVICAKSLHLFNLERGILPILDARPDNAISTDSHKPQSSTDSPNNNSTITTTDSIAGIAAALSDPNDILAHGSTGTNSTSKDSNTQAENMERTVINFVKSQLCQKLEKLKQQQAKLNTANQARKKRVATWLEEIAAKSKQVEETDGTLRELVIQKKILELKVMKSKRYLCACLLVLGNVLEEQNQLRHRLTHLLFTEDLQLERAFQLLLAQNPFED